MSISNAMLLCFASGMPNGLRDRQRFELVPKITTKMCKLNSQQPSDRSCFCTNTRTHTRHNKPDRLGVAPAGVVGARGRCCPAATVPAAVVIARVVCCIAKKSNTKTTTSSDGAWRRSRRARSYWHSRRANRGSQHTVATLRGAALVGRLLWRHNIE